MTTKQLPQWRYFYATKDSPTAQKMDAVDKEHRELDVALNALRKNLPDNLELISLKHNVFSRIEMFGVRSRDGSEPDTHSWKETKVEDVYVATVNNEFSETQAELVKRVEKILDWPFALGEESFEHSCSLSVIGAGKDEKTATAHRLLEGSWLFATPIDPSRNRYYMPSGAKEITETEAEKIYCEHRNSLGEKPAQEKTTPFRSAYPDDLPHVRGAFTSREFKY